MSETLIGVIIGGILTSLGGWIAIWIQHRRWVNESRIARLDAKFKQLEVAYEKSLCELLKGMNEGAISSEMLSEFRFLFPEVVSNSFEDFLKDKDINDEQSKRRHFLKIASAMKVSLKDIEDQIDAIVLGKEG